MDPPPFVRSFAGRGTWVGDQLDDCRVFAGVEPKECGTLFGGIDPSHCKPALHHLFFARAALAGARVEDEEVDRPGWRAPEGHAGGSLWILGSCHVCGQDLRIQQALMQNPYGRVVKTPGVMPIGGARRCRGFNAQRPRGDHAGRVLRREAKLIECPFDLEIAGRTC